LIDPRRPGDFNQAIMELGALVCLPRAPRCGHCPIAEACATRGGGARGAPEVRKTAQVSYFLARRDGGVRLVQRAHNESLMAGMWELPEGSAVGSHGNGTRFRHSILDTDFHVVVYETNEAGDRGEWIKISRLRRLPLTGLTRKILRHFELA
jgi:A/G-specific adenine glycosylase